MFALLVAVVTALSETTPTLAQSTVAADVAVATYPALITDPELEPVYSRLWGQTGEKWNAERAAAEPEKVLLRDHTNVGYELGNAPIPSDDWPIWKSLPELGGIPNDGLSDVSALRQAMEQCPPNHVIFLPAGRYIIDEQIIWSVEQSHVAIRGESRDGTILFFPKHSREIHQKITDKEPMIYISGGEHRGLEDLSLVFRDEQKATGHFKSQTDSQQNDEHWFYVGESAVAFRDKARNSWLRNIYIKNANHPIDVSGGSTQITVTDIVLDQFYSRTASKSRMDGHMGIKVGGYATRILVHNVLITGDYVHDVVVMGCKWSVFSRIQSLTSMKLDHHARYNSFNLWTEVDAAEGGNGWGEDLNNLQETYWGVTSQLPDEYLPTGRKCTFVGVHTDLGTSIGDSWHYESLQPRALEPANMYLAQMAQRPDKYLPPYRDLLPLPAPPVVYDKVFQISPSDDLSLSPSRPYAPVLNINGKTRTGFVKFNFTSTPGLAGSTTVASARLRFYAGDLSFDSFTFFIYKVSDDTWNEDSLEYDTRPAQGALLYTTTVYPEQFPIWFEVDITDWVNENLAAGDEQVSITFVGSDDGEQKGREQMQIRSKEDMANSLHLNVVLDQDLADPPAAPTGLVAQTGYYWIHLNWDNNIEPDMAYYNVYKQREGSDENSKREAMGLVASAYTDFAVERGKTYKYTVTAVDLANFESVVSETVVAKPCENCEATKQPPLKRVYPLGIFSTTGDSMNGGVVDNGEEDDDSGSMNGGVVDNGEEDDDSTALEPIFCVTSYRDIKSCRSDSRCIWSAGFCWDSSKDTYTPTAATSNAAATSNNLALGAILSVALLFWHNRIG